MHIDGYRVIESVHVVKSVETTRARTWRERLISWPWRPWIGEVAETATVPSDEIFTVGNTLVMHPQTARKLRAGMGGQQW